MASINERIAQVIKETKLTKTAFAKKINLSQSFVSNICAGVSSPSDRTIADICKTFNISEVWLRTGDGDMFASSTSNSLDALAAEYNLSPDIRNIIERILNLDQPLQEVVMDFAIKLATALADGESPLDILRLPKQPITNQQEAGETAELGEDQR